MMTEFGKSWLLAGLLPAACLHACSPASKATNAGAGTPTASSPAPPDGALNQGATSTAQQTSGASPNDDDLKAAPPISMSLLASSLAIKVTKSIAGTGTHSSLATSQQSLAACNVRASIETAEAALYSVIYDVCTVGQLHQTVTGSFQGHFVDGASDFAFKADRLGPQELQLYVCNGGKLTDTIHLTGVNGNAMRGSVALQIAPSEIPFSGDWKVASALLWGTFDNHFTAPDRSSAETWSQVQYTNGITETDDDVEAVPDAGTSIVTTVKQLSGAPATYAPLQVGLAKYDDQFGAELLGPAAVFGDGNLETRYFDAAGYVVAGPTPQSKPGGDLFIDPADLPAGLSPSLAAPTFTAWDCQGAPLVPDNVAVDNSACAAMSQAVRTISDAEADCFQSQYVDQ